MLPVGCQALRWRAVGIAIALRPRLSRSGAKSVFCAACAHRHSQAACCASRRQTHFQRQRERCRACQTCFARIGAVAVGFCPRRPRCSCPTLGFWPAGRRRSCQFSTSAAASAPWTTTITVRFVRSPASWRFRPRSCVRELPNASCRRPVQGPGLVLLTCCKLPMQRLCEIALVLSRRRARSSAAGTLRRERLHAFREQRALSRHGGAATNSAVPVQPAT